MPGKQHVMEERVNSNTYPHGSILKTGSHTSIYISQVNLRFICLTVSGHLLTSNECRGYKISTGSPQGMKTVGDLHLYLDEKRSCEGRELDRTGSE